LYSIPKSGLQPCAAILLKIVSPFLASKDRRRIIETFSSLPLIIPEKRDHVDAADLRVKLRQKGIQAGRIDVLLVQLCLRHGLSLLSMDKDFVHMGELVPLSLI